MGIIIKTNPIVTQVVLFKLENLIVGKAAEIQGRKAYVLNTRILLDLDTLFFFWRFDVNSNFLSSILTFCHLESVDDSLLSTLSILPRRGPIAHHFSRTPRFFFYTTEIYVYEPIPKSTNAKFC